MTKSVAVPGMERTNQLIERLIARRGDVCHSGQAQFETNGLKWWCHFINAYLLMHLMNWSSERSFGLSIACLRSLCVRRMSVRISKVRCVTLCMSCLRCTKMANYSPWALVSVAAAVGVLVSLAFSSRFQLTDNNIFIIISIGSGLSLNYTPNGNAN